jgi:hypothetical protein
MGSVPEELPDWERLLAAERHLQHPVPGAILVGGTAAAIHAGHRVSMDGDHVRDDLRARFDEVLTRLEAAAGWQTDRIQRPVLILGQLDGILTGIRQLRRTRPLETEMLDGLRVPWLESCWRARREHGCARSVARPLEPFRSGPGERRGPGAVARSGRNSRLAGALSPGPERCALARAHSPDGLDGPGALPHFWLAALASLGEQVDWTAPVPDYYAASGI